MNIFIDCEFTCLPGDNSSSDLLSIGIYCEDGSQYYGCRNDFDLNELTPFSKENVVPFLPKISERKTKETICEEISNFLADKIVSTVWARFPTKEQLKYLFGADANIEQIYTNYADWDYQLLLRYMMNVPEDFPVYCEDITPLYESLTTDKIPANEQAHNALQDAIWNYKVWKIGNAANHA